uniref:Carbamoyl-phosphate synthase large subunit (CarB, CPA2) n=1 Tax=uncultured marine thaumarchaeote SAT1000_09_H09 TaxID=1456371 RepID=A0A075I436_9ARCH|nr:carbamoyl-phosphate synthase large subunit (carB, CPA2) [uncultured marine thaumarchaeote SAT1000_09_H09]
MPITPQYVESIIEKERPDGIMLSYGGQTALNCGVKIDESGILKNMAYLFWEHRFQELWQQKIGRSSRMLWLNAMYQF